MVDNISKAWQEVYEKKTLDPVDHDELKGKHKDREDGDIDNDGDTDASDKYLHKKRKAISKAIKKEEVDESSCGSVNASKKIKKEDDSEMETDEPMAKDGMKKCKECGGSSENHDEECSQYASSEKSKASATKEAVRHEVHGYGEIITETDNGYDILFAHGVEFDVPAEQCESIRRAMDIAKKSGGAMTPAVKKMDKIKKGVSDNPRVKKALQKANEEEEVDEANLRKMDHDEFMKHGDSNPKGRADPAWNAERKRRYRNDQAKNYRKMKKEEDDVDEAQMRTRAAHRDELKRREKISQSKKMKKEEDDVDEARNGGDDDPCWDTHKKVGTKMKDGKRVNDCVPKNEEVEIQENTVAELDSNVSETYSVIQQQAIAAMRSMWEGAGAVADKKAKPDPKGQPSDDQDTNLKGKGAVDMAKDLDATGADTTKVPKGGDDEVGHDDASKAGRVTKPAAKRPGDQQTGDKSVVNPVNKNK